MRDPVPPVEAFHDQVMVVGWLEVTYGTGVDGVIWAGGAVVVVVEPPEVEETTVTVPTDEAAPRESWE